MESTREIEIWRRLVRGASVEDLCTRTPDGLIDLRGVTLPKPSVSRLARNDPNSPEVLEGLTVVRGARWEGMDFSGAELSSLRLLDVHIDQCVFDKSRCLDWRIWGSTVSRSRFVSANLRGSALGGVENGRVNQYVGVSWKLTDMRGAAYRSADFVDCTFERTKLAKMDFGGSRFVRCRFSGELREVIFHRTAWEAEHLAPNEMTDVDFSQARLRFVEFRELDLRSVRWPIDDAHVVVQNYRKVLDLALRSFESRDDRGSQGLAAYLELYRKWAGPNQEVGIFNREDLREVGGVDAAAEFLQLVEGTRKGDGF
jgi:uncharacterized protein YjbI with pentapeptide repeats